MSTVVQHKRLTAEEFSLQPSPPNGMQQELVCGEIIAVPPSGGLHGATCAKIAPEERTLTIHRVAEESRLLHESANVTDEDVLPGFVCSASDLLP